jgi:4a-hydroxytetrahydrobiopterin dehydratase
MKAMSETLPLPAGWKPVSHPPSLFCRYEFTCYAATREFLDGLMLLSEETQLFPDLGFGKTHVNVTIHGRNGGMPGDAEIDFAARAASLAAAGVL